jgi:septum formation protein
LRRIVLASASPRRADLLRQIGLAFEVDPSGRDEAMPDDLDATRCAEHLALSKALSVSRNHLDAITIAADTLGVLDGRVFGKPASAREAREMLARLSGRGHTVVTGYAIIDPAKEKTVTGSVQTTVYFRELTREEINAYVDTGEPMDKAGAYAIQGLGSVLVERIEGDYYNVIGLPLSRIAEELKVFGVSVLGG